MNEKIPRREVLRDVALAAVALCGGAGCGRKALLVCSDTTGMSTADLTVRTTLAYSDISTDPTKLCSQCQHFVSAGPNACGTCKVVKGPINPRGSCKSYVLKGTEGGATTT